MKKVIVIFVLFCCASYGQQDVFTDPRDGRKYKTVKIGSQIWMAENLNYNTKGKCYKDSDYPNEAANCEKYGRLYFWENAKTSCPIGWHLPSNAEWEILLNYLGGKKTVDEVAFKVYKGMEKIKAKDGFAALCGGEFYIDYHENDDLNYEFMGYSGCWFSASHGYSDGELWWFEGENGVDKMKLRFINEVTEGCSVRCLKN